MAISGPPDEQCERKRVITRDHTPDDPNIDSLALDGHSLDNERDGCVFRQYRSAGIGRSRNDARKPKLGIRSSPVQGCDDPLHSTFRLIRAAGVPQKSPGKVAQPVRVHVKLDIKRTGHVR